MDAQTAASGEAANVLRREIERYNAMRDDLERDHMDRWVVLHGEEMAGAFETFQEAAIEAAHRFGRGPYLIRQVGALPERLPSAAVYGREYAHG